MHKCTYARMHDCMCMYACVCDCMCVCVFTYACMTLNVYNIRACVYVRARVRVTKRSSSLAMIRQRQQA